MDRRDDEIDRVIQLLKSLDFLKQNKGLSYVHYRDLAISMSYQEYEKDQCVYMIGQEADSVFVVLNGEVQEQQKNSKIKNWEWAYSLFRVLQEWKANEWDPRAQRMFIQNDIKTRLRSQTERNLTLLLNNVQKIDSVSRKGEKSPQYNRMQKLEMMNNWQSFLSQKKEIDKSSNDANSGNYSCKIKMTKEDRDNFKSLKRLQQMHWFLKVKNYGRGQLFGE